MADKSSKTDKNTPLMRQYLEMKEDSAGSSEDTQVTAVVTADDPSAEQKDQAKVEETYSWNDSDDV